MHTSNLLADAWSRGYDLRSFTHAQIESATELVALHTTRSDPRFPDYVASIVAEMSSTTRH